MTNSSGSCGPHTSAPDLAIPTRAVPGRGWPGARQADDEECRRVGPGQNETPARQGRAGARLGISVIAAHSLCPSLGIANLVSDAGFDNNCRHVAKLKQVGGLWAGRRLGGVER